MRKKVFLIITVLFLCLIPIVKVGALDNVYILADTVDVQSEVCLTYDKILGKYFSWAVMLMPVLVMVLISVDFIKAVVASDAEKMKKASSNAIKRMTALVAFIALPYILSLIFDLVGMNHCF